VTQGRRLSTGLSVSVNLLPFGGFNDLPLFNLQNLLGAASSPAFSVSQVTSAAVEAVCGNGICEVGERPNVPAGESGCVADCPYPVVVCPVGSNGRQCSGAGACLSSGGQGVCACWGSYGGDACATCAGGYTNSSSGSCVRLESSVLVLSKHSNNDITKAVLGGVLGGGLGAVVVGAIVYVILKRRFPEDANKAAVKPVLFPGDDRDAEFADPAVADSALSPSAINTLARVEDGGAKADEAKGEALPEAV